MNCLGVLSGIVQSGRGLGAELMGDRDLVGSLPKLADFPIVPGTLNVRLPQPLERGAGWRYFAAAEISPGWGARSRQAGYFLADVVIVGRYRGVALQADEPGYRSDQVELISEVHLRKTLGLRDGDPITFSLRATERARNPAEV